MARGKGGWLASEARYYNLANLRLRYAQMPITEHTINDALAALLRTTRREWSVAGVVSSENTGILKHMAKRPDILVAEPNVSPVVIETEVAPGASVEVDALSRLGAQVKASGRPILSSIAVRLPSRLRTKSGAALASELAKADDLGVALYTGGSPTEYSRWPHSGWILATIGDLSILTQSATVPPEVIEEAADHLVNGVSDAAEVLREVAASHSGSVHKISEDLRQEDGEQTRRMATTILANAFVFMESLAGGPGELAKVESLDELRSSPRGLSKSSILAEWRKILAINYWPIFDIARRILEHVPAQYSAPLIEGLAATAERLLEKSLMRSHDLTGAVFQRLIADRKFLAAYYTTPAAAALLAGLAIDPDKTPSGTDWSDAEAVKVLRIADFACGTGTLLSTTYQRIGQIHELAGGDAEALHPELMAEGIVGCDVVPAAAHLTASMLAGSHPTTKYAQSSILTFAYGEQSVGRIALGSLDLLDPQGKLETVAITAKTAGAHGEGERDTWSSLPHSVFDLVIMNPPFVRDTGHEGKKKGVPNPMFAAFSISPNEQKQIVKQKSRDFFWYSPVLKRELEAVTADVVVSPTSEAEVRTILAAAYKLGIPVTPRGAGTGNYGQAMPLMGGVLLNLAEMNTDPVDRAGTRHLRAWRAADRRRQSVRSVRAGIADVPVDARNRVGRRLRRRRVRRRRLDHLGGPARFRQCAAPARHDARGRAAHARIDGRGSAQGGARLWDERDHNRSRDAAHRALRLGQRHCRVRQFRRGDSLRAGARRAGWNPEEACHGRRGADAARLFSAPSRAHPARRQRRHSDDRSACARRFRSLYPALQGCAYPARIRAARPPRRSPACPPITN